MFALDLFTMRLHGGYHIGKEGKQMGKIFLNQQIDGVTAGGNDDITLFLVQHALVFRFDHGSTDGCFFCIGKSQFLQCVAHGVDSTPS